MSGNNVISAALIGLGGIAWKYDARRPGQEWPLSQAGAMKRHNGIKITGGCSPDPKDREAFSAWLGGVAVFAEAEEMLSCLKPSLVGICSPPECHYEHARLSMEAGARFIWLEKPPAVSTEELRGLMELSKKSGSVICVDYIRRYMPACRLMREMILGNVYGKCSQFLMRYSPGLARNGSHLLDLCFFLSGATGGSILWVEPGGGCAPAFAIRLNTGQLIIAGSGNMSYHTNDLSAVCESGIINMRRGGKNFKIEKQVANTSHPGFHELREIEAVALAQAGNEGHMVNALSDLLDAGSTGRSPCCNLHTCLLSQELLEGILRRSAK